MRNYDFPSNDKHLSYMHKSTKPRANLDCVAAVNMAKPTYSTRAGARSPLPLLPCSLQCSVSWCSRQAAAVGAKPRGGAPGKGTPGGDADRSWPRPLVR